MPRPITVSAAFPGRQARIAVLPSGAIMKRAFAPSQVSPPSAEVKAYGRDFDGRYADRLAELVSHLRADPEVSSTTFALTTPGYEPGVQIEVEGVPMPAESASCHAVRFARVASSPRSFLGVPRRSERESSRATCPSSCSFSRRPT